MRHAILPPTTYSFPTSVLVESCASSMEFLTLGKWNASLLLLSRSFMSAREILPFFFSSVCSIERMFRRIVEATRIMNGM